MSGGHTRIVTYDIPSCRPRSSCAGRADVIGVKADIASLAGRPGLRRRRNRLATARQRPLMRNTVLGRP